MGEAEAIKHLKEAKQLLNEKPCKSTMYWDAKTGEVVDTRTDRQKRLDALRK